LNQKKLHVLFICGWYPSRVLPTNGDFIERHAQAVAKQHKVSVIHLITDKKITKDIELSTKVINEIETHIAYLKEVKNPIKKIYLFLKAFSLLLKKVSVFDIVHLNELFPFGVFSLYLKWFKKKPFIISEHWTAYKHPLSNKISFIEKTISKIIVKNASYICPVSNDLASSMQSLDLKGNYKRVPNVVNTNLFFPDHKKNEIFTITHVSNMNDKHKNVKGLLHVIAKLEVENIDFKFNIIGKNSIKYLKYANKLGLDSKKIKFMNQIPHTEIAKELRNSNLFVLFSNYENLPCVILESFSCGVPVISTNVGGISEYFPDNFGKLIIKNDEEKLKEEILNFYNKKNNVATKDEMHTYVKSLFSEQAIANNFTNLYYKTLSI